METNLDILYIIFALYGETAIIFNRARKRAG